MERSAMRVFILFGKSKTAVGSAQDAVQELPNCAGWVWDFVQRSSCFGLCGVKVIMHRLEWGVGCRKALPRLAGRAELYAGQTLWIPHQAFPPMYPAGLLCMFSFVYV